MSTRRKKKIPHVHRPGECFSVEHFPETLPFDPVACPVAASEHEPVVAASLDEESIAAPEEDQQLDEILEDLAEDLE